MKNRSLLLNSFLSTLIFCICSFGQLKAQEPTPNFWDQVRFGGGIGLSFGSGYFSGTLAPSAIYEFNPQFAAGLGLNFTYRSEKDFYNSTIFGGSVITLYNVIPQIQLSAELEQLKEHRSYDPDIIFVRAPEVDFWYTALFLGAGYRTQYVTVGVRYDVLYKENESIYGTAWLPFVRVYF